MVGSGDIHSGHYYSFIKLFSETWLRFDDERVTKVDPYTAVDMNFGGLGQEVNIPLDNDISNRPMKTNSAYMLFYIRTDRKQELLECKPLSQVNPHSTNADIQHS